MQFLGVNPAEKAKAVIEEIEEIKKIEHAMIEAVEQGRYDYRNKERKSRSRSRSTGKMEY